MSASVVCGPIVRSLLHRVCRPGAPKLLAEALKAQKTKGWETDNALIGFKPYTMVELVDRFNNKTRFNGSNMQENDHYDLFLGCIIVLLYVNYGQTGNINALGRTSCFFAPPCLLVAASSL